MSLRTTMDPNGSAKPPPQSLLGRVTRRQAVRRTPTRTGIVAATIKPDMARPRRATCIYTPVRQIRLYAGPARDPGCMSHHDVNESDSRRPESKVPVAALCRSYSMSMSALPALDVALI